MLILKNDMKVVQGGYFSILQLVLYILGLGLLLNTLHIYNSNILHY